MAGNQMQIRIGADISDATAGLNALNTSVNKTGQALKNIQRPTGQATNALTNLGRVVQDAPFGFIGIANNLNPLLESFQRLQKETGSTGKALKAMGSQLAGPAGIGIAVATLSSLFIVFGDDILKAGRRVDDFKKSIYDATEASGAELVKLKSLVGIIQDSTQARRVQTNAFNELQKLYPDALRNYDLEAIKAGRAAEAIKTLTNTIYQKALAEVYAKKAAEKQVEILEKQAGLARQAANLGGQGGLGGFFEGVLDRIVSGTSLLGNPLDKASGDIQKLEEELKRFEDLARGAFAQSFDIELTKAVKKGLSDAQRNIIRFAEFISRSNLFLIPLKFQFSDLDTEAEKLKKAIKILSGVNDFSIPVKINFVIDPKEGVPNTDTILPGFLSGKDAEVFKSLFPQEAAEQGIQMTKEQAKQIAELTAEFYALGSAGRKALQEIDFTNIDEGIEKAKAKLEAIKQFMQLTVQLLQAPFEQFFLAIQQGRNAVDAFFDTFIQGVQQLIAKLAAAAAIAGILSLFGLDKFTTLFGNLTGIKIPKAAQGGIVPPGFGGDTYPALLSSGEAILNSDQIRSLIQSTSGGGAVRFSGRVRGTDIVLSSNRTNRSQSRR